MRWVGVALYRNGDWDEAIAALQDSVDLGADIPHNWLFIAMAHWQQGNKEAARSLLEKSIAWREQNKPDDELIRFFAEAEKLIGPVSRVEMRENSQTTRIPSPPAIQSPPPLLVHHDSAVYLSRSDGGRMRRVVHVEDYQWHSRPTISPKGELLAWTAFRQRLTSPSVFIGDLKGEITYQVEGGRWPPLAKRPIPPLRKGWRGCRPCRRRRSC